MEQPKDVETFITNMPDEVIGYYGSGSNSYLFFAVPLTFMAGVACQILSYGGIPFVALAMLAWYKVLRPGINFVINHRGVLIQSAFGYSKWVYFWPELNSFHFTVKVVYGRYGSAVRNTIVFRKNDGKQLVLHLFGMEKQFDEIREKVERLTAYQTIINEGIVHG
jgi:hypothetical protein